MKTLVLVSLFLVACGGPNFQEEEATEADGGSDSNPPVPDSTPPLPPEGGALDGTGGFEADAWPTDVVLVPYCPTSEVYPNYSNVCYVWGAEHGWTIPGCCLTDHTCGTTYNNRCNP